MSKKYKLLAWLSILAIIILITIILLLNFNNKQTADSSWLTDFPAYQKCLYQDKIVYYVVSPCCDQYNYLYNQSGKKICAPDGGMTGQGDGKCTDFNFDTAQCQLINK